MLHALHAPSAANFKHIFTILLDLQEAARGSALSCPQRPYLTMEKALEVLDPIFVFSVVQTVLFVRETLPRVQGVLQDSFCMWMFVRTLVPLVILQVI